MVRVGTTRHTDPAALGPSLIDEIESVLRREGVLPAGTRAPVNLHLGRSMLLEFFPAGTAPVAVKAVSDDPDAANSLRREFDALSLQLPSYADLIPKPLTLTSTGAVTLFAMENISHRNLGIAELDRLPDARVDRLVAFLTDRDKPLPAGLENAPNILDQYMEARSSLPPALAQTMADLEASRDWRGKLAALKPVPQHSDLSMNNIGLCKNGVIVFDWEDYGNVVLPGFDFLTLVLSGLKFSAEAVEVYVKTHMESTDHPGAWCRTVADALNLNTGHAFDFAMITAIVFLDQKKKLGYGTKITGYLEQMLSDAATRFFR